MISEREHPPVFPQAAFCLEKTGGIASAHAALPPKPLGILPWPSHLGNAEAMREPTTGKPVKVECEWIHGSPSPSPEKIPPSTSTPSYTHNLSMHPTRGGIWMAWAFPWSNESGAKSWNQRCLKQVVPSFPMTSPRPALREDRLAVSPVTWGAPPTSWPVISD